MNNEKEIIQAIQTLSDNVHEITHILDDLLNTVELLAKRDLQRRRDEKLQDDEHSTDEEIMNHG